MRGVSGFERVLSAPAMPWTMASSGLTEPISKYIDGSSRDQAVEFESYTAFKSWVELPCPIAHMNVRSAGRPHLLIHSDSATSLALARFAGSYVSMALSIFSRLTASSAENSASFSLPIS